MIEDTFTNNVPTHQYLTDVQSCYRHNHGQIIDQESFISMNLLQMPCVLLFTSEVGKAVRGQNTNLSAQHGTFTQHSAHFKVTVCLPKTNKKQSKH